MSAMQKLLKITSIAMLVLGGLFIPLTVMNFIHAETFPGIIIAVLTALTALFDIRSRAKQWCKSPVPPRRCIRGAPQD